jgi:predicted acetyltransferase
MPNLTPFLVRPSAQYKDSFIRATYEYIQENLGISWNPKILEERFPEYIRTLHDKETDPMAGYVPSTQFWLILNGDTYAGELDVRHHLNDSLRRFGGHIGYKVSPTLRRMGYGKLMCKLGIQEARKMGITDILITCDDDNIGSQKIIEANNGILQDTIDNERGVLTRRYWIYYQNY